MFIVNIWCLLFTFDVCVVWLLLLLLLLLLILILDVANVDVCETSKLCIETREIDSYSTSATSNNNNKVIRH